MYSRLLAKASNGEDVTGEARTARFNDRNLSNEDYLKLNTMVKEQRDGLRNPVNVNRDFVTGSLGKYATEIGLPQAAALGNAEREYDERVAEFQKEKGRLPTFSEARDIGNDVVRRYSLFSAEEMVTQIPTPRFMQPGQKASKKTTSADMDAIAKKTADFYLQKNSGDVERMKNDPEFRREMDAIRQLKTIYQGREQEATTNAAAK